MNALSFARRGWQNARKRAWGSPVFVPACARLARSTKSTMVAARPLKLLAFVVVFLTPLICADSRTAVLPAGTQLEARLSTPVGSRISHRGDRVEATVIAPILDPYRRPILSQGATVSGRVENVEALGFGFKHAAAQIKLRFDSLRLPDGGVLPIRSRVREVETARERVDSKGNIHGIHPTANVSSALSFLMLDAELTVPVVAMNVLAARSPDSEIYLPVGAELCLEVTSEIVLAGLDALPEATPGLISDDIEKVQYLLGGLPGQQTSLGHEHASDLINVLLLGSGDQVDTAFRAAGWTGQNKHSILSLYRMYHSLVQRKGYSMAPMSTLTLNGVAQSRVYQKSLDTLARRHHVRLWRQSNANAWLGAASEDVGFTTRGMHITHAIDSEIDSERAKVVNDLLFTGCVGTASLLSRESLKPVREKGFSPVTDGEIAVLRLNDCEHPRTVPKPSLAICRRSRIKQALAAIANDIARANPFTVTCISVRSVTSLHGRKTKIPKSQEAQGWRRPSVIESRSENVYQRSVPDSGPGYEHASSVEVGGIDGR